MQSFRLNYRCAATWGYLLVVAWIVGCDQNQASPPAAEPQVRPKIRNGAFREAAGAGNLDLVREALKQGIDINDRDPAGRTALMFAAFEGQTEVIALLLEHRAQVNLRDSGGTTALIFAGSGPNAETVRALLDAGAEIDAVDGDEKYTALMYAASLGHVDVAKLLLSRGAKTDIRDIDGDTALDFAIKNNHPEVVQLLMGK